MKVSEPALDRLATARRLLLEPYGLDEGRLQGVLATIFEHSADYADLYFQYTRSESFSLEEGIVKSGSFDIEQGVGVRAIVGDKTAFAYSDDISSESLTEAALSARAIARHGNGRVKVAPRIAPRRQPVLYATADPVASLDAAAKVSMLERVERFARARDPRVKQVMASIGAEYDVVLIARSDGVLAADVRPLVRLSVNVIVEGTGELAGQREQGFAGGGGRFDLGYFDDAVLADYAEKAVDQALLNLAAKPAPAGDMTGGARAGLARDPAARGGRPRPRGGLQPQGDERVRRPGRASRSRRAA